MTHIGGIYFTYLNLGGDWLNALSGNIQKPASDISLQSVEPVDLFFLSVNRVMFLVDGA